MRMFRLWTGLDIQVKVHLREEEPWGLFVIFSMEALEPLMEVKKKQIAAPLE